MNRGGVTNSVVRTLLFLYEFYQPEEEDDEMFQAFDWLESSYLQKIQKKTKKKGRRVYSLQAIGTVNKTQQQN